MSNIGITDEYKSTVYEIEYVNAPFNVSPQTKRYHADKHDLKYNDLIARKIESTGDEVKKDIVVVIEPNTN